MKLKINTKSRVIPQPVNKGLKVIPDINRDTKELIVLLNYFIRTTNFSEAVSLDIMANNNPHKSVEFLIKVLANKLIEKDPSLKKLKVKELMEKICYSDIP